MNDTIGTPRMVGFIPSQWVALSAWQIKLGNPPLGVYSRPIDTQYLDTPYRGPERRQQWVNRTEQLGEALCPT